MLKCPVTTSHLKCWYHPDPQPPWSLHHQLSTGPRCLQSPRPPAHPQSRAQSPRPHPVSLPSQPALTAHVCARLHKSAHICTHLLTSAHITSAHMSAHACSHLFASAHVCTHLLTSAQVCSNLRTSAHVCSRLRMCAHVCAHLHTTANVCSRLLKRLLTSAPRLNICKVRLSSCCSSSGSFPDLECL